MKRFYLLLAFCFLSAALSAASPLPTAAPAPESPRLSPSGILPLQPPLTIEDSLTELESLLDNWETDSLTLWLELQKLQTIVEELKSTLTQSETLAEGLALSLEQERSKTQSLRRWLVISISGGVVVSIVAFCLGAYSSP